MAACRVAQHGLDFYLPPLWPALRAREEPPRLRQATASSGLSRWSARAHYFGRGGKRNREPGRLRSPEVVYQRCDSRIYWAWAIISSRWHRRYVSVPRWLFQERRLSLTLRLTFAVQRSCELEHLATTSQPSFVCLLLSKAHKVSPARAPSVSMTVSKKPLRSSAEQALASAAHMPMKDMLTASSVNNFFSRVPSLSATGTFRPGVWTRVSSAAGSAALRGPGSLEPPRPRGTGRDSNSFAGPGRDRSDANQCANAIGWDVLTRADTATGRGVSTRTDTAGG